MIPSSYGYAGEYIKRDRKGCNEGEATFFKLKKFTLVSCDRISITEQLKKVYHSLTHSLTYSLSQSFTHLLTHLLTYSLTLSLTYSQSQSFTHSPTGSLTHSLTHSLLTHSLNYSLTPPLHVLSLLGIGD